MKSVFCREGCTDAHTLPLTQCSTGSVQAGHSFSLPSCFWWYRKMGDPIGLPPSILWPCLAVNEQNWWGKSKPNILIGKRHAIETRWLCPGGSLVLEFQWGKFRQWNVGFAFQNECLCQAFLFYMPLLFQRKLELWVSPAQSKSSFKILFHRRFVNFQGFHAGIEQNPSFELFNLETCLLFSTNILQGFKTFNTASSHISALGHCGSGWHSQFFPDQRKALAPLSGEAPSVVAKPTWKGLTGLAHVLVPPYLIERI